jgi:hypothetical protein
MTMMHILENEKNIYASLLLKKIKRGFKQIEKLQCKGIFNKCNRFYVDL